jgi:hypothetical protein
MLSGSGILGVVSLLRRQLFQFHPALPLTYPRRSVGRSGFGARKLRG